MPRPNLPLAKDVVAIVAGLKSEGLTSGVIKLPDGTEIIWGQELSRDSESTSDDDFSNCDLRMGK